MCGDVWCHTEFRMEINFFVRQDMVSCMAFTQHKTNHMWAIHTRLAMHEQSTQESM